MKMVIAYDRMLLLEPSEAMDEKLGIRHCRDNYLENSSYRFVAFNICFGIAMVILFLMILQVSSVSQSN